MEYKRERYVEIDGFSDYMISDRGNYKRVTKGRGSCVPGKVLKGSTNPWGYRIVKLCKDGKVHAYSCHKLTLIHHGGPRPVGNYVAHHIDGDIKNNDISNLEWVLDSEHRSIHGKVPKPYKRLTKKEVHQILVSSKINGMTKKQLSEYYNVDQASIANIIAGRTHKDVYNKFMESDKKYTVLDHYDYTHKRQRRYTYGSTATANAY